MKYWS